jgi:serine/threonine protein kinase
MSPELLQGKHYKFLTDITMNSKGNGYDMKSDVWSLGCIIYELCEFKSPFRNENEKMSLMDLFSNITKGDYK